MWVSCQKLAFLVLLSLVISSICNGQNTTSSSPPIFTTSNPFPCPQTNPCHQNATCTQPPDSPIQCNCNIGFTGDGRTCTDLCSVMGTCSAQATCTHTGNQIQPIRCTCITGYTGNGTQCTDINECPGACLGNATCQNTVGSFVCNCPLGYTYNGSQCIDVNECATGAVDCALNSTCINFAGGYRCVCDSGFIGGGFICLVNPCTSYTCGFNASCKLVDGNNRILNSSQTNPTQPGPGAIDPNTINAQCFCDAGLGGNANQGCSIGIPNPCQTMTCAGNATCRLFVLRNGRPLDMPFNQPVLYGLLPGDSINATCQCDYSFIGNGDVYCAAACLANQHFSGPTVVSFPSTVYPLTAYSNELCPFTGQPLATAPCGVRFVTVSESSIPSVPSYSFLTATHVPCNKESLTTFISQIPVTMLNSTSLDTILGELDAKTYNSTNLNQQDISATVGFINNVSANATTVPISPFSYQRIVNIADHVTAFYDQSTTSRTTGVPEADLVQSLTTLAYRVTLPASASTITISTPSIEAEVTDQMNPTQDLQFSPIVQRAQGPNFYISLQPVSIVIPLEALLIAAQSPGGGLIRRKRATTMGNNTVRAVFILHNNSTLFPTTEKADWIVSGNVGNQNTSAAVSNLANPVNVTHNTVNETAGKAQNDTTLTAQYVNETCVFWNFTTQSWSTEGCCLEPNTNPPLCKCNHLTNFALLVSIYDIPASIPQQIVSTVGCSISIASLIFTIILLLISKDIRQRRPMRVLINICVNLSVVYLIFLVGIDKRDSENGCIASATLLHYFLLVSWCWMAVYGHLLYKSIVKIFHVSWDNYLIKVSAISYGLPLIVVAINIGVNKAYEIPSGESPVCGQALPSALAHTYLAENMCWIHGYSLYIAFLLPVACLISFNVAMFVLVMRSLTCKRKKISSTSQNPSNLHNLAIAFSIASTLGVVWFFGFFMMVSNNPQYLAAMSWMFTIVAAFQGFCVFVLTCVRQGDVRRLWWPPVQKIFCCKKDEGSVVSTSKTGTGNRTNGETGSGTGLRQINYEENPEVSLTVGKTEAT